MPYQKELDRKQVFFTCLEDLIAEDSHARIIDCFIDSLDLKSMGFAKSLPAVEGRPSYSASNLLKLFLYGSRHSLNSSRKLEEACRINLEVKWLLRGLEPDFRQYPTSAGTISCIWKKSSSSSTAAFLSLLKQVSMR